MLDNSSCFRYEMKSPVNYWLVDSLILTAYQLVSGYFMLRCEEIAFIVCVVKLTDCNVTGLTGF